jgi:hypothetical protein
MNEYIEGRMTGIKGYSCQVYVVQSWWEKVQESSFEEKLPCIPWEGT